MRNDVKKKKIKKVETDKILWKKVDDSLCWDGSF